MIAWGWPLGALPILAGALYWRRWYVKAHTPSLVADLETWNKAMPLPKPRVLYAGTQVVDRKALAKALKGSTPKAARTLRLLKRRA